MICININMSVNKGAYMTFFSKTLIAFTLSAALTACSSTPVESGQPINFAKLERVSLGVSTQESVKQVFGYPQSIEYPDNRTIYRYRYRYEDGDVISKQAIDFVFNKRMRLIDFTINDGDTSYNALGKSTE